ncbi:hypothetical protein [Aeromicrobium massiliense]|uniref:hypothetical protein n=1 Tax=Aeromicrobium massiliense TaxID=1464554 RepID=UPI000AC99D95|nr:hypothetical protein [Aeromicrobium massiliense]
MPDDVLLVCAAALAVVALVASAAALVAARRLRRATEELRAVTEQARQAPAPAPVAPAPVSPAPERLDAAVVAIRADDDVVDAEIVELDLEPDVHVVDGRVVVRPSDQQVVAATLGRPLVRLSVVGAGLAHALRPESRDRISGLVRRDFRRRRRARARAARRAARTTHVPPPEPPTWIGGNPGGGAS